MKPTIISGICKGMKLEVPEGGSTRPTSARAREALLSSLQNRIDGARTLDLFAGSGAFSFECMSRGTAEAVLVENNRLASKSIEKNFQELQNRFHKQNLAVPFFRSLAISVDKADSQFERIGIQPDSFDIIFADPPYEKMDESLPVVIALARKYLAKDGVLVFEFSSDRTKDWEYFAQNNTSYTFKILQQKRYGLVSFVFFVRLNAE